MHSYIHKSYIHTESTYNRYTRTHKFVSSIELQLHTTAYTLTSTCTRIQTITHANKHNVLPVCRPSKEMLEEEIIL